ncbi:MAG: hypothetical protein HY885_11395 [Deltaproteobacteria bacterium]|nr:hypothetical protein [Deltaproteobacteria bacterium]
MKTKKMNAVFFHGCVLLVSILFASANAAAQFGPGGSFTTEQELDMLQQNITLTTEQLTEITALLEKTTATREAILASYGLSNEQFETLMEALRVNMDSYFHDLQKLLSDEQKKILRHSYGPMNGHRPPPIRDEKQYVDLARKE